MEESLHEVPYRWLGLSRIIVFFFSKLPFASYKANSSIVVFIVFSKNANYMIFVCIVWVEEKVASLVRIMAIHYLVLWVLGWMFQHWDLFMGSLCGRMTLLLHGHDLSMLRFNSLECLLMCVFEFLDSII
jgi:hypothetical protein